MRYAILYGITEHNKIDGKLLFQQVLFAISKEEIDRMIKIEPTAVYTSYKDSTNEHAIIKKLESQGKCKIEWREVDCDGLKYHAWIKV